jgi:hypothetical protein
MKKEEGISICALVLGLKAPMKKAGLAGGITELQTTCICFF